MSHLQIDPCLLLRHSLPRRPAYQLGPRRLKQAMVAPKHSFPRVTMVLLSSQHPSHLKVHHRLDSLLLPGLGLQRVPRAPRPFHRASSNRDMVEVDEAHSTPVACKPTKKLLIRLRPSGRYFCNTGLGLKL